MEEGVSNCGNYEREGWRREQKRVNLEGKASSPRLPRDVKHRI